MASRKNDNEGRKELDADTARDLDRQYRAGVDVSDEEVAARFEADGYDPNEAKRLIAEAEAREASEASEEG
jgi:hypothetical protein